MLCVTACNKVIEEHVTNLGAAKSSRYKAAPLFWGSLARVASAVLCCSPLHHGYGTQSERSFATWVSGGVS
jgi:hypothetical protein